MPSLFLLNPLPPNLPMLWPLSSLLLVRMPFFLAFMLFGHPHFINWSQVSSLIHWSTSMLVFPSHAVCCLIYLLVGGLKFAFDQDILKPYYRRGGGSSTDGRGPFPATLSLLVPPYLTKQESPLWVRRLGSSSIWVVGQLQQGAHRHRRIIHQRTTTIQDSQ